MNKISLRITGGLFLFAFMFCMSCSKKTSTPTTTPPPQNTQQAQARGQQQSDRAQRGPRQFSDILAKMDQNKDGKLASSEMQGRMKDNFTKIDTNGDGFITKEEFENAPRPPKGRRN